MYWDRFDICEAWYVFASLWHGGKGSWLYAKLGQLDRLGFKPGIMLRGRSNLSENGQAIYDGLVQAHGKPAWSDTWVSHG